MRKNAVVLPFAVKKSRGTASSVAVVVGDVVRKNTKEGESMNELAIDGYVTLDELEDPYVGRHNSEDEKFLGSDLSRGSAVALEELRIQLANSTESR